MRFVVVAFVLLGCVVLSAGAPAIANPDGPVRSLLLESTYSSIPNADPDGSDRRRFGLRASFPVSSLLTFRVMWADVNYALLVDSEGTSSISEDGVALSARLFVALTANAMSYLRGKQSATANPDGPVQSFSVEVTGGHGKVADTQVQVLVPVLRYASVGASVGWRRLPIPDLTDAERATFSNNFNRRWVAFRVRAYLPLTASAKVYHADVAVGLNHLLWAVAMPRSVGSANQRIVDLVHLRSSPVTRQLWS